LTGSLVTACTLPTERPAGPAAERCRHGAHAQARPPRAAWAGAWNLGSRADPTP